MLRDKPLFVKFLLTRLLRGVTTVFFISDNNNEFLLTRLLRGVTIGTDNPIRVDCISTHTPLARRDVMGLFSIFSL